MLALIRQNIRRAASLTLAVFLILSTLPPALVAAATTSSLQFVAASASVGAMQCTAGYTAPQCDAQPFDTTNDLAYSGNGYAQPAVAFDDISGYPGIHEQQNVNDGKYGNGASWISNSSNSWVKIDLGRVVSLDTLQFGRDRTGNFDDRDPGQFQIYTATSDDVYAAGNASNDGTEYTQVFDSSAFGFSGIISGPQTVRATFPTVQARYIKLQVASLGADVDEVEVFAPSSSSGSLSVSGTVTNQSGGGVLNASVYATAPGGSTALYGPTTTNSSGSYTLGVDPGTYDIHFDPPSGSGLNPIIQTNYAVTANQTLNVQFAPPQHVIAGTVQDGSGNALSGLTLKFRVTSNSSPVTAITDTNGHYSVTANATAYFLDSITGTSSLLGGSVNIASQLSGNNMPQYDITNGDLTNANFVLSAASLNVTVLDGTGNPVANAPVTAGTSLHWNLVSIVPGSSTGYYQFATSRSGSTNSLGVANFTVVSNDYNTGSICATVNSNQVCNSSPVSVVGTTNTTLQLPPQHIIAGTVQDSNGTALPGLTLKFRVTSNNSPVTAVTDTNGHYAVTANATAYFLDSITGTAPAPLGSINIASQLSGNNMPQYDITNGDLNAVNFVLPTATLSVAVVDGNGSPVPSAPVTAGTSLHWNLVAITPGSSTGYYQYATTKSGSTNSQGVVTFTVLSNSYNTGSICTTVSGNQTCNTSPVNVSGSTSTTLQLPPQHIIAGTLQDDKGNALSGLTLKFRVTSNNSPVTAATDANGHYSVAANATTYFLDSITGSSPLLGGSVNIASQLSGNNMPQYDITNGDLTSVNFVLPTATLNVTVKDGYGNPVVNTSVTAGTSLHWNLVAITPGSSTGYYQYATTKSGSTNSQGSVTFTVVSNAYNTGSICTTISGNQTCNTTAINVSGSTNLLFQAAPQAPPAPTGLAASSPTSTAPVLNWSVVSVASSYNIYRNGVKIGSTTATTFTDSSLTVTGTYNYNVTAVSALNVESSTSNTISVVFYGPGPVVTHVQISPSTVSVNQTATLSANVSDANASVTAAEYFEGTDPGQGNGTPMSIVAGVAAATLPGTLSVGQHTFSVRALDGLGNWTTGTLPTAALTVTLPIFNGKVTNFAAIGVSGVRVDVVSPANHANVIATTTTDGSGNYSVTVSTPGTYDVIYTPSDATNQPLIKTSIDLTSSRTLNAQLPAVQHTISGTITKSDGAPAPFLSLKLCLTTNSSICVTASDSDAATGHYSATVNAGIYNVTQLAGSSTQPLGTVVIQPYNSALALDATSGNVMQDLQLPVGSINVTAKDSYGNLASGASISVYDAYATFPIVSGGSATYANVATHLGTTNSAGNVIIGDIATTYSAGSICANINSHVTCNTSSVTLAPNGTASVLIQATPQAPLAPTGLTANSPTSTAPVLNWSPAAGASTYNIYRGGTMIGSASGTIFTDSGLAVNGTYTYTVTAVSALNLESTASNTVTVIFTQVPLVTNVQINPATISVNQTATLSANVTSANATVAAAEYFEGADPGQGNGTPMAVVAGMASATLPSTLSVGQHTFYVRAEDNLGNWTTGPLPAAALTVTLPILSGRVVNGANDGLSGVQVDVVSQSDHTNVAATTSTDSNGNYVVTVSTPGTYDVILTPSDSHYEQVIKTGINLMMSNTLDVVMALRPTTFKGTLTDENYTPIAGATISLHNSGGQNASGTTDQSGAFTVTVNPSTYALTISGAKAASPSAFIPVNFTLSGGSFDLTNNISGVPLVIRATTVGLITKSSLTGLAVGSVALSIGASTSTTLYVGSDTYTGSAAYNVTTDGSGNASVVMLEGSTYAVTAVPPTNSGVLTTSFAQVGPVASDPPARELDMNADVKDYSGRVTDGTEITGLIGVTVLLSGANGTFQTTTDGTGHFDVQAAAGTYTLSILGNASSGASMPGTYSLSGYGVDLTGANPTPVVFPIRTSHVTVTAKTSFGTTLDGVGISLTSVAGNVTVGNYVFTGSASSSGTTANGSVGMYVLDDLAYNTKAVPAGGGYITTNTSAPSPIVESDTAWDIVLNRELHEFKGIVIDKNGQLVQGATIRLDGNEPDQHYSMTTASDGAFDLFVAPNSAYSLQISGTQATSTSAYLPDNYILSKTVDVTSDVTSNTVINAVDLQLLARDDRMNLIDGVGINLSSSGSQNGFAASTANVSRTTANGGQADVRILSGTSYTITATPPANLGYINTTFNGTSPVTQDGQIILEFQNHIPLAPGCPHVTSPTNQVPVITWCAVTNADHYLVYRNGVQVGSSVSTTFPDTALASDGTYSYRVAAISADGYSSPLSDPVSAVYDTTAPSLQYSLSAEPNVNGWNNAPVTVTYACADALAGVASCPAPQTESVDAVYDLSATAIDNAGNSTTVTSEVKIDQTAPTIAYTLSPTPNSNGWNNGDVTVTFLCADATSGITSCSTPVTVSAEGASQHITGTAVDNAGNTSSVTATVNLDKTGPILGYDLSAAPNANGWNNTPVTITYYCSDALSGVASCPSAQTISDDGIHLITATATDNAGNSTTINLAIKVDQTLPTISYTITPTPNANGWNNGDVTVSFDCQDATSGVQSCTPPQTLTTEGASQTVTGTAVDYAGNAESVTAMVNIDKTAPVVTGINWSANPLVQGQSTTLSATATDNLSHVASMYYTVNSGSPQPLTFNTATGTWDATFGTGLAVNTYNIMVYAVDNAGNVSAQKPDVLAVYSTTSGSLSGHAWIMPTATDTMPIALDTSNHPTPLVLGFSSQQGATTSVDAHYIVKNNQDEFSFSSTTVDWVVIPDSTHASLLVHGTLTIYQGGAVTTINDETMRLDVVLGTTGVADQINMRMWNPLLDPNSVSPTYQVNDSDLPNQSQLFIR